MEDDLTNSYVNKSVDSKETSDDQNPEESGWTGYFEDFFSNQKEEQYSDDRNTITYGGATTTCLASDAASFVVEHKKGSKTACSSTDHSLPNFSKKLNFKKTRTKEISYDESLEDTASSPVNSPKVMQGKGGSPGHGLEPETAERSNTDLVLEGKNNDCTDLRKKGLCLVPMYMLHLNYSERFIVVKAGDRQRDIMTWVCLRYPAGNPTINSSARLSCYNYHF